ncbi:hypothetical protein T459_00828 [Capsicum annuum]|uniref:Isopenicillin N synthase-like Fe(2+) 2OG dioxygenase domain-containing protein n=1 Tax=Capsicum annuum TaxID=4072 RepID=A0A2G3AFD4_CAPAN|nr:hypothetical protein T459_00828 [Capsicum annuum]
MGKDTEELPSSGRYSNENGGTLICQIKTHHQPLTGSDLVHGYAKGLSEFDEMIQKMIFEKLGIFEKYWDEHKNSTNGALGLLRYRVPKAEETNVGLTGHSDKLMTTVLSQRQIGKSELKVMMKNGEWIDVEYSSPHSFVFFLGDIFTALTNGRLPSPFHRVIVGNKERYSIVYSADAKEGYIIKVAEELVDEDHPLRYKPFDPLKYFLYCMTESNQALRAELEHAREKIDEQQREFAEEKAKSADIEVALRGQIKLDTTRGSHIAELAASHRQQLQEVEKNMQEEFDKERFQWIREREILREQLEVVSACEQHAKEIVDFRDRQSHKWDQAFSFL